MKKSKKVNISVLSQDADMLLIGKFGFRSSKDFNKLSKELIINDPHIRIVKFIEVDFNNQNSIHSEHQLDLNTIDGFLTSNFVSEIVVANDSKNTSIEIYNKLLEVSENGIPITQYEDVYEDLTSRIPLHLKDKSLYKFFPFSKKQKNPFEPHCHHAVRRIFLRLFRSNRFHYSRLHQRSLAG